MPGEAVGRERRASAPGHRQCVVETGAAREAAVTLARRFRM
jgi:hypothetical protein